MLPVDFIDNMSRQLGEELDSFCQAMNESATVSIRLNDKLPRTQLDVISQADESLRVPWSEDGWYLKTRPQFTLDPLLHAGCYYVQEPSSMFLEYVLKQLVPHSAVVLDLCAAPGGKSTIISQHLKDEGLLVSNEVVRQRVFVLSENMQKWGNGNCVVTHNKPAEFGQKLPAAFDCILVDAPCSGEGMFRKDEKAQEEWSLQNIQMCAKRQKDILANVWEALKPGGIIIYSTCTFNETENEQITRFISRELGAETISLDIPQEWGIVQTDGYHFYPHKVKGEGLYMSVLRKAESRFETWKAPSGKRNNGKERIADEEFLRSWLLTPDRWHLRQTERFTVALPVQHREIIEYLYSCFTCLSAGFGVSELRGRTQYPQHSLSMAKDIRKDKFQKVELDLPAALDYLRAQAIVLEEQPHGLLLLTYKSIPLGFAKNIGNHCNNLYPNEWRIRHS